MKPVKILPRSACLAIAVVIFALYACNPLPATPISVETRTPMPGSDLNPTPSAMPPTQTPTPALEETLVTQETEQPSATPNSPLAPVVVVSFDGAANKRVSEWMESGVLPNFARLVEEGLRAESMTTIDPALTAAAHASMVTGFYPNQTGIVGNLYHNPNDSFYWYRSGFNQPLDQVDPVWVTVSQAGLKTASLFIAGGTPFLPGQTADYTIAYGARDAYSSQEILELRPLEEDWTGEKPVSYSLPLEAAWVIPKVSQVFVYALDSLDDGFTRYDSLILNTQRSFSGAALLPEIGKWEPFTLLPSTGAGAHFLLQEVVNENNTVYAVIYHSGVHHNLATPRALLQALNERFGFFPASGDAYALEHGWINADQFLEMLERSNRWMTDVTAWVYGTYHPDLTFTWLDAFDTAGHAFTPTNPGAPGYEEILASQHEANLEQAARIADQSLARLLNTIPLEEATLVLVSDHGMANVHTTVNLNTLLEEQGWLVLDDKDYVVVDQSRAIAFSSGGSAHIYINLEGRDRDGFVTEEEYTLVRQQIAASLSGLENPENGERVFSRILLREQLADLHLDHTHSGDIFAQANPGYNLDSHRGRWRLFEPTQFTGQHGYDCILPDMQAIFIAAGAGVSQSGQVIAPIHITDLAPTILAMLGIAPQSDLPGRVIPGISALP
jgi:predicted AlkP superfamily phosphohydrolase/phosphomutase